MSRQEGTLYLLFGFPLLPVIADFLAERDRQSAAPAPRRAEGVMSRYAPRFRAAWSPSAPA
jgi:hypothetical protein